MRAAAAVAPVADHYAGRAAALAPGRGRLDLGLIVTRDLALGTLDVAHAFNQSWSAYGHAEAGRAYGAWHAAALAGLRLRW